MNKYNIDFSSPTLKFSVSGLRGIYPSDLNLYNMMPLVQAFSLTLGQGDVAIARDTRKSGEAIYHLVSAVLTACGHNVHHLGIVPTPTIKLYVRQKNLRGGIMVSASHNPMQYNAFKFIGDKGFFFNAQENKIWQQQLKNLQTQNTNPWKEFFAVGNVLAHCRSEAQNLHIENVIASVFDKNFLSPQAKNLSSLKVAIDPVGACACNIIPMLLEKLGVPHVSVHGKFSDRFERKAEPTPDALHALGELVKNEKCDIGFAFDPDADRLALVDENGKPLGEEYTLALTLSQVLRERKGNCVVNLSTSWLNRYVCEKNNCQIFLSSVGEANVVSEMLKTNAVFGGEGNGGIIDPQISSIGRDSLSGVAWMLRLLVEEKKPLSQLAQELPRVVMEKRALNMQADEIKILAEKIKSSGLLTKLDTRDGYHFSAPSGLPWLHLRASNTEPIVRLMAEAANQEELNKILALF